MNSKVVVYGVGVREECHNNISEKNNTLQLKKQQNLNTKIIN
jgi:hypothetical protein